MAYKIQVIVLSLVLVGCVSEKSAVRFLNNHPQVADSFCLATFPIRVETDTVIYHFDRVLYDSDKDSAYNELLDYADSLYNIKRKNDTVYLFRRFKCPEKTREIVRTYENKALVNQLRGRVQELEAELTDFGQKVDNRNKILASLGSLIVGMIGIYIRGKFKT